MIDRNPIDDVEAFFKSFDNNLELGSWLNAALQHYFVTTSEREGRGRFDGLHPFRTLFAGMEQPVEWLQSLWQSVKHNDPRRMPQLSAALRAAIGSLPRQTPDEKPPAPVVASATTYLQFIRRERAGEVLPAVQAEFLRPRIGWSLDDRLMFETLSAVQSCSEQPYARRFAEALVKAKVYKDSRLSNRHRATLFVSIVAGFAPDEMEECIKLCKPFDDYLATIKPAIRTPQEDTFDDGMGTLRGHVWEHLRCTALIESNEEKLEYLSSQLRQCAHMFLPDVGDAQGLAIEKKLEQLYKRG